MSALFLAVTLVCFLVAGYWAGVFRERGRLSRALSPSVRAVLSPHIETLREVLRAAEGEVSPELEAAIGRMLAPPPSASADAWDVFWADMAPETDTDAAFDFLRRWVGKVKWDGNKRAMVIKKFTNAFSRTEARRVIDREFLGDV